MRLRNSPAVRGSQSAPTVYVDAGLPGANRIARFLGDEGWEVVSGASEIPPMSVPIVFFGPSTDVELWAKLLESGGLRAIAVGDDADSDVVVGALEAGFDQFVQWLEGDPRYQERKAESFSIRATCRCLWENRQSGSHPVNLRSSRFFPIVPARWCQSVF